MRYRWRRARKKVFITIAVAILLAIFLRADAGARAKMLVAAQSAIMVALQFLLMIFMAIIQFVAIFWFMSQMKVEIIKPGDPTRITFADYKGQPNLLRLVQQWIGLLEDRRKFSKMGGELLNGLLLTGEPGTGKTFLAKAMAGEGNVAFISIEGSGFRALFWGVDVLRMLWFVGKAKKLAKAHGACIAYIDEIDAVGASRGGVMGGKGGAVGGARGAPLFGGGMGALSRLLYEMDGVKETGKLERLANKLREWLGFEIPKRDWHLLFMGATNRPSALDPALTRPGRFDTIVQVDKPDAAGRREVVRYYLDKITCDKAVNIDAIVQDTVWATPAKIMSAITKDAVRLALYAGRDAVAQEDIDLAFQEQAMGLENPIAEMQPDQRQQIAYHEAGHAVVQHVARPDERIVRVSIVRRQGALGYVLPVPKYDIYAMPLKKIVADVMVSLAGAVSTEVFLGEPWTGATADFRAVRARLLFLYDNGFFGAPIYTIQGMAEQPPKEAMKIVREYWDGLIEKVAALLKEHESQVHALAAALLEHGDLSGERVVEIIEGEVINEKSE